MNSNCVAFLAGGIGDQLLHLSQLQAFSKLYSSRVDLYCQHQNTMSLILEKSEWSGKIFDNADLKKISNFSKFSNSIRSLEHKKYQNAIVCHPSTSLKLASSLSKIPNRIGVKSSLFDIFLLTEKLNIADKQTNSVWGHRPFVQAFNDFLDHQHQNPIGTTPIFIDPKNKTKAEKFLAKYQKPHIIVNLYTADKLRRWPISHAIDLLSKLSKATNCSIFLSSGSDAIRWNKDFLDQWPKNICKPIDLSKICSSITDELGFYHSADLYIGVNSFTSNLAINCDLPSLVMYNKRNDFLNYRQNSIGVFSENTRDLSTITEAQFFNCFKRIKIA